MKALLAIFFVFLAKIPTASAEGPLAFDVSAGLGTRSLPLGATLIGELGYQHLLWGGGAKGDPFYGYLRPSAKLQTSGVVNRAQGTLAIHPVSFWGIELGYGQSHRATELDTLDCGLLECGGGLERASLGSSLVLGRAGFFVGWTVTGQRLTPSRTGKDFADESSSLAGRRGGDTLVTNEGFAGYELMPDLRTGFLFSRDRMLGSGARSSLNSAFARLDYGAWAFTLGAGIFESSTRTPGGTVFGLIRWKGVFTLD
ncbi:MAG: hypothetical protein NDJ89_10980 [Oligoflexia bacterium]|nr:hypothetical protein [Oligoflexia bacterium]